MLDLTYWLTPLPWLGEIDTAAGKIDLRTEAWICKNVHIVGQPRMSAADLFELVYAFMEANPDVIQEH